jgi:hypothetical protein
VARKPSFLGSSVQRGQVYHTCVGPLKGEIVCDSETPRAYTGWVSPSLGCAHNRRPVPIEDQLAGSWVNMIGTRTGLCLDDLLDQKYCQSRGSVGAQTR